MPGCVPGAMPGSMVGLQCLTCCRDGLSQAPALPHALHPGMAHARPPHTHHAITLSAVLAAQLAVSLSQSDLDELAASLYVGGSKATATALLHLQALAAIWWAGPLEQRRAITS